MTLITPRHKGMLVVMQINVIGSQTLLNSIRGMRFVSGGKPTTLPSSFSYAIKSEADRSTLDIWCWWWKHLRLPIRDRERGWINYSKHWFQTQPCFSCFLFFVLRTAEWRRTVSLWLQTSFCYLKADVRRHKRMLSCKYEFVWLIDYIQIRMCNLHVSICSINYGALFGGGCEETREDAIFSCVKGQLELNKFWQGAIAVSESQVFSCFFLEYKRAVGFLGVR